MSTVKIYTYSVLFSTSEEFKDKLPYIAALLEDEQGTRFPALLEGYQPGLEVKIGQPVHCRTDSEGKTHYSI